jgi:hypothetical protein
MPLSDSNAGMPQALRTTQERNRRKAARCQQAGVTMIEWPHTHRIDLGVFRYRLGEAGFLWPQAE